MIFQQFQSSQNKNALISVIQDTLQKEMGKKNVKLDSYYQGIQETMNYVQQNVSKEVPYGMSEEDYLIMMNKKTYSIIFPVIKKDLQEKLQKIEIIPPTPPRMISINTQSKESRGSRIQPQKQDPLFDPVIMEKYENIPIAEYPSPSFPKVKESQMGERVDELRSRREDFYIKPKEVKFQDEIEAIPKRMVNDMYQQRKVDYEKQSQSISHFEDFQNQTNEEVEEIVRNRNEYNAIPIDLFENQKGGDFQELFKEKKKEKTELETNVQTFQLKTSSQKEAMYDEKINQLKSSGDLGYSPFINESPKLTSVILPPTVETYEKRYRIMINSLDRNKYMFPYQNDFEIKFNPASSSYRFDTYVDSYGEVIYRGKEIVYSDSSIGATIPITFDNIRQISLLEVLVPVIGFYAGGRGPVVFNSAVPATGQTTTFEQYNPIATRTTGIPQGVYKEPFLYLVVPELEHNFYATDTIGNKAFSKLIPDFSSNTGFISVYTSTFTFLRPDGRTDFYRYDPITKGKLDKFTPKICNFRGKEYDFGIDKLIIDGFVKSTLRYSGYCGSEYYTTQFFIKKTDPSYANYCSRFSTYLKNCDTLSSTPLVPGDLLYFYNTLPIEQDIIFFERNIQVFNFVNIDADTVKINAGYVKDGVNRDLNFQNFIPGGNTNTFEIYNQYYIAFSMNIPGHVGLKTFYFRIVGFKEGDVLVKRTTVFDTNIQISQIAQFGYVKNNPQGLQEDNKKSLFDRNGHYIYRVGTIQTNGQIATENTDQYKISLDFPYEYLTEYFESIASNYTYQSGDFFLVQHKLQLIYEFEITVATKNIDSIRSNLEGTGLNF
jgi:hypothetical protein